MKNLAFLKDWPLNIVIVDILWGVVICSAAAITSFYIASYASNAIAAAHEEKEAFKVGVPRDGIFGRTTH